MNATAKALDPVDLLPVKILGYVSDNRDELADADGLFSLIDGGAEVYRSLNVRRVLERRYVKKGFPDVIVDVFDMGTSADAFGAFHHDLREGSSAGIGQESEQQGANLCFWKDIWYVSIVPLRQSQDGNQVVLSIGKAIADRINAQGSPPGLTRLLPQNGLVKSQVHYFHDWPLLSRLAFLPGNNPLGLGKDTEGLLARYRFEPNKADEYNQPALLLIRYPTPERASAALRKAGIEFCETRQLGRTLAGVLFCKTKEPARTLLNSISIEEGDEP